MSEAQDLFRQYIRQRREMGEPPLVLDAPHATDAQDPNERAAAAPRAQPPAPEVTPRRDAPASAPRAAKDETEPGRDGESWKRDAPPIPPVGVVVDAPSADLFAEDPLAQLDMGGLAEAVHACTACGLHQGRTHAVPGEGPLDAKLVVVGEGPGAQEDESGRPFVGRAGQLLTDILGAIGFARDEVFICNVVKCRPPENRTPNPAEIEACIPFLHRQLAILQPAVILAMGATAATSLLGVRGSLGSMRNRVHEFRGTPLVVTYHPAALLRNPHWKKSTWDDVRVARQLVDRRA
jgi:DNA polymerase